MKIISFIEQPSVIRRILKHLELWEDPRPPPRILELLCEPDVDYIPWKDDVSGADSDMEKNQISYVKTGCEPVTGPSGKGSDNLLMQPQ